MTQAQIDLLRRMAEQAQQADIDVGLGANVLIALLDEQQAWKQKCNEVSAELATWLAALNEWADTNSRSELTAADRKLFALAEEARQ